MTAERLIRALPYVVVLLASAYLYYAATQIEFYAPEGRIGPNAWPKMVLGLMLFTCAYGIFRSLTASLRDLRVSDELVDGGAADDEAEQEPAKLYPGLLIAGIVATLIYVAVIRTAGFFLATVVYLAAFMILGRYRNWLVISLTSVVGSLLMLFFFMKVVYVSLPLGEPPFQQVTLFLMKIFGIR
jgi:putative tricarboxylic transport membrane protein